MWVGSCFVRCSCANLLGFPSGDAPRYLHGDCLKIFRNAGCRFGFCICGFGFSAKDLPPFGAFAKSPLEFVRQQPPFPAGLGSLFCVTHTQPEHQTRLRAFMGSENMASGSAP